VHRIATNSCLLCHEDDERSMTSSAFTKPGWKKFRGYVTLRVSTTTYHSGNIILSKSPLFDLHAMNAHASYY